MRLLRPDGTDKLKMGGTKREQDIQPKMPEWQVKCGKPQPEEGRQEDRTQDQTLGTPYEHTRHLAATVA